MAAIMTIPSCISIKMGIRGVCVILRIRYVDSETS